MSIIKKHHIGAYTKYFLSIYSDPYFKSICSYIDSKAISLVLHIKWMLGLLSSVKLKDKSD